MLTHQIPSQIANLITEPTKAATEASPSVVCNVSVGTSVAEGAETLHVGFTYWLRWRQTMAVGFEEEGCEGEGELGLGLRGFVCAEDLGGEEGGGGAGRCDYGGHSLGVRDERW